METRSEPARWSVQAPESPATLRRIPSTGDLLLVWNHNYEPRAGHSGRRTPLNRILEAFQSGNLPKALVPVFVRRKDDVPCRAWSWSNQLLVALEAGEMLGG